MSDTSTYSEDSFTNTTSNSSAYLNAVFPENKVKSTSRRHRFHNFLDNPSSSRWAFIYGVFTTLMIMLFTVLFLVASVPQFYRYSNAFDIVQTVVGAIFTADYLLRLCTADNPGRWALYPLSILDLLVVIPFFLNWIPSIHIKNQFFALRAVRLFALLKIIKISRYVKMTKVIIRTLRKSKDGFIVLTFGMAVMCVFFSTLVYLAESTGEHFNSTDHTWYNDDGTRSEFQNIFEAMWWCVVTFTTVGYGDMVPQTTLGKLVGVCAMFTGILLTALPVAIFTTNFMDLWKEHRQKQRLIYNANLIHLIQKPKSQHEKEVQIAKLLLAIEKEEAQIAGAISTANDMLLQCARSHDQLRALLEELRERVVDEVRKENGLSGVYNKENDAPGKGDEGGKEDPGGKQDPGGKEDPGGGGNGGGQNEGVQPLSAENVAENEGLARNEDEDEQEEKEAEKEWEEESIKEENDESVDESKNYENTNKIKTENTGENGRFQTGDVGNSGGGNSGGGNSAGGISARRTSAGGSATENSGKAEEGRTKETKTPEQERAKKEVRFAADDVEMDQFIS